MPKVPFPFTLMASFILPPAVKELLYLPGVDEDPTLRI
jgi:hypothetical protein